MKEAGKADHPSTHSFVVHAALAVCPHDHLQGDAQVLWPPLLPQVSKKVQTLFGRRECGWFLRGKG